MTELLKLNLGCGYDLREGYVNVDKYGESVGADLTWDLEVLPWPWADNSASEIVLKHILEHLGQETNLYLNIIKEIYRVSAPDAKIYIEVPYPFHPHYIGDATHCRPVTAIGLQMFNLTYADYLIREKSIATPLARYVGVDFVMLENLEFYDQELRVLQYSKIILEARKPFGVKPQDVKDIKICVHGPGIGDVCMGLCTAHSLADAGFRVSFVAQPNFHDLIRACPHVYSVTSVQTDDEIWLTAAWLHFQQCHQVDTFNKMCGLRDVPNESKSLDINIPQHILDAVAAKYPGTNRVVIHPAGRDKGKKWPTVYWQQLTNRLLADGREVVAIGMDNWLGDAAHHLEGVVDEFNQHPLYTMALLRHCDLMISACSGPIQMAATSECAILGLYSLMPPESRLPYRHGELGWNALGLMPSCEFAPCMEKLVVAEPEFEWTEPVYKKMAAGLSLGEVFTTWCLNEAEPFSCMASISVDSAYDAACKLLAVPQNGE